MSRGRKFYEVLGVPASASKEDIKKAYKKRAMECHPDKGGDPEEFKAISSAYDVLKDDQARAKYDHLGDEGFTAAGGANGGGGGGGDPHNFPFGGMDPHSVFEQMFGGMGGMHGNPFGGMHGGPGGPGGPAPPHRCNDHVHTVRMTLAEAFAGVSKTVRVNIKKECMQCRSTCHVCQGRGQITDMRRMGFMTQVMTRPCDACQGSGQQCAPKAGCHECKGTGSNTVDHKLDVVFPAGVADKHRVVFKGMGEQPKRKQDAAGNLIFEAAIMPDAHFTREGNDLVFRPTLTLGESLMGMELLIPHFGGDIVLNTAETFGIVKEGQTYVIPRKGMTAAGALKIICRVQYPPETKKLTATERELLGNALNKLGLYNL